jgi:Kef-type K+ transport system membrane component KefB
MELHFTNLLIVVTMGFLAPLALGFAPRLLLPSVVLEIVAGIVVGPSVLGWVHVDQPVEVMAIVGLAFLLFLAGLEIEFDKLRGKVLRVTAIGFAISFGIALILSGALSGFGVLDHPLFVAIVLSATSLGVVIPVLKDAGEVDTTFGQLVIAGATIADFATVILLSLFFSREATTTTTKVILLGLLFVVAILVGLTLVRLEHWRRLRETLQRLQDTTAQIRIRGAFVLLIALVALATKLGLEVILGAFIAGAILTLIDRDTMLTHPDFRAKLEAAGFGIFIPVFFVTSGVRYDLGALGDASTLLHVPIFLVALFAIRGLPALLYRPLIPPNRVAVSMLMQATSLPFIVASTAIGVQLEVVTPENAAALIAAGLLSVVLFPAGALTLLKRDPDTRARMESHPESGMSPAGEAR